MSTSPLPPDPYEALGVSKDADADTIKKAHRKLVLKHHPDRIKDPALVEQGKNEFQKVQQAYELLIDPVQRQRHDDEVRLAQLRRERMMSERETPAPRTSYTRTTYAARPSPAAPQTTPREVPRESKQEPRYAYEERAPDAYFEGPNSKAYEDPIPRAAARKDPHEKRSSTSKATEKKEKPKASGWDRTVGAGISMRMAWGLSGKAQKARSKVEEREAHARNAKARDKEERRERSEKEQQRASYGRYASPKVDDDSTDSSDDDSVIGTARQRMPPKPTSRMPPRERSPQPMPRDKSPRPPYRDRPSRAAARDRSPPAGKTKRLLTPEPPKRRQPSPRRFSVSDVEEYDSPDEWEYRHSDAREYIETSKVEARAPPGRPPLSRQGSAHQYWTASSPRDHRRSGSDSDRQPRPTSAPKPSRRSVPPEDGELPHRPQLHPHTSAPAGVRAAAAAAAARGPDREMPTPRSRQGSYDSRTAGNHRKLFAEIPELKRTSSDPISPRSAPRKDTAPPKPSTLKQAETTHDSGYGSSSNPHTPEMRGDSPPREARSRETTTKYRAKMDDDDAHHRARKLPDEGDDLRRFLSPQSAQPGHHPEERRERRSSRSREPQPRSRSKRGAAGERRPSISHAESTLRPDEPRTRAKTIERSPERYTGANRPVDSSKINFSSYGAPNFTNTKYDGHHARAEGLHRMREPRKASVY